MDRGAWRGTVLGVARVRHALATEQQQKASSVVLKVCSGGPSAGRLLGM